MIKQKKRNGLVDVYKFIFCWMIVLFHFYSDGRHFPRGDYGVEFFVIVSGVYFFLSCEKIDKENTGGGYYRYIIKRYLRFILYTLAAFTVSFFINRIWIYTMHNHHMMSFSELVSNFPNDLNEILLIKMIGLSTSNKGFSGFLNSPVWTVSAMIIVEFLIICLLSYKKELYYNVICPFSIIIGTGICNNAENLRVGAWLGFCSAGLLRVYVLTCISYYCYILAKLIYKQKFTLHKEILLSLVEFICIVFLLIIMMLSRADWKTYIIPAILFTSIASAIAISGKGISSKIIKSNKLTNYLGKLSFAIFLIHIPIVNLFNAYLKDYNAIYSHKFLFVAMVLLASMIFNFVMDCILRSTGLTKINNT